MRSDRLGAHLRVAGRRTALRRLQPLLRGRVVGPQRGAVRWCLVGGHAPWPRRLRAMLMAERFRSIARGATARDQALSRLYARSACPKDELCASKPAVLVILYLLYIF